MPKEKEAEPIKNTSDDFAALRDKIVELEKKDAENQEKLKMLYEVADKGRVFNYESGKQGKQPLRVKLSKYSGGIIVGWRTVKDELVKHPTTGKTVGEVQEYELLIQGDDGNVKKTTVNGYPSFSDARYTDRLEAEVIGRKESWDGAITLDVRLPNGKTASLDAKYVN